MRISLPGRTLRAATAAAMLPAIAVLTGFAAPAGSGAAAETITITARDFAFVGPDTVTAGRTTIKLLNRGKELHHVQLVRLDEGRSVKEYFDAIAAGGPPPSWARDVGGPNTPVPGGESVATLDLPAGRYALLCFIPSPDGTPHLMKGMSKELTAVAPKAAKGRRAGATTAGGPVPRVTMTLDDYSFALSRPFRAGTNTIRVKNVAAQPHEVLVVRLAPGKSSKDFFAWAHTQEGPPPGSPIGGTTGIATGGWNDITVRLTPGNYGLICFLPDAKDRKPHAAHGMTSDFSIR